MKAWTSWLARIGLAGSCIVWSGCGGGGVPDPSSDSQAATEAAPAAAPAPAQVAPEKSEPVASAPVAPAAAPSPVAEAEKASPSAPAEGGAAPGAKTDGSSTAEMLALAGSAAPPPASAGDKPAGETAPAPGYGAAGGSGGPPPGYGPAVSAGGPPPGYGPAGPPGEGGAMASARGAGGQPPSGPPPGYGQPGDSGGGRGGFGGTGGDNSPPDFTTPWGGGATFLAALRAKDPARLHEATAARAPFECHEKNKKLFEALVEESMSQEDLDELAKLLEGYTITGQNTPKSSAVFSLIMTKASDRTTTLVRRLTMRKEKAGWKVMDIGGKGELESPIMVPRGRTTGRRR